MYSEGESVLLEETRNQQDPLADEYHQWKEALAQCVKGLQKKQTSLQTELEKASQVEGTVQRAELITSNMYLFTPGVRTATLHDWNQDGALVECTLNGAYDSASAEADALFQQARKIKRGSQIVGRLLEEVFAAQASLLEIQLDLEAAAVSESHETVNENVLRLVQDRLVRSAKTTGFRVPTTDTDTSEGGKKQPSSHGKRQVKAAVGTPASNLRKLLSPGGCTVMVGRNRKGNEYLTFNIARGDDVWMQYVYDTTRPCATAVMECVYKERLV
jgi:predicted ribosome quality control (RQC) complex YloA/Tae2 family protein